MKRFLEELKRRNVYRVTVIYVVGSWLLLQVADTLFPAFGMPDQAMRVLAIALLFSFPLVLLFTYAFELTPDGIRVTRPAGVGNTPAITTGDYFISVLLLGVIVLTVHQQGSIFGRERKTAESAAAPTLQESAVPADRKDSALPMPSFSSRAAIAVLPFVNMSDDPEQEYFADGLTEDLITGLQSFRSFPIIARTSTFTYKSSPMDVRDIAAELGAGYVIEGSARKVTNDVRINVQLINQEGLHVWADSFDFKFEDVLRVQSELVTKILHAIEPELIISEADRARFVRTEEMEAFDYFLRGTTNTFAPFAHTDLNGHEVTPERMELAREYATKAVELDPNFAAGWRLLNHIDGGYAVQLAYLFTEEELEEIIQRAIRYGERSRQLSPFEPTVCSCLAAMLLMSGDIDGARLLQEESLKQNPGNAGVHAVMSKILQVDGDPERALGEIRLAKRLSPEDMAMTTFLYFEAAILQDLGHFDEAVTAANKSILLNRQNYDAWYVKITSLYAGGDREAALQTVLQLREISPPAFTPRSAWDQPFVQSAADKIVLASGASLQGLRYNDGLHLVFEDLGWHSIAIKDAGSPL